MNAWKGSACAWGLRRQEAAGPGGAVVEAHQFLGSSSAVMESVLTGEVSRGVGIERQSVIKPRSRGDMRTHGLVGSIPPPGQPQPSRQCGW